MTALPQCDHCTPLGVDHRQQAGEMAIFVPARSEWLCAGCRALAGQADALVVTPGTFRKGEAGFIPPGSPEWLSFITPSKVAAIMRESRWESPFSLWNRMKGLVPPEPPKDIFTVGHAFEKALAELWKEERTDWLLSPGEVQIVLPNDKLGFPAIVTLDRRGVRGPLRKAVEFKIARDLADMELWGAELTDECPDDYWTQVQAQMLFTGWVTQAANLMVCGPFWNYRIYDIDFSPSAGSEITEKCTDFFASLRNDEAPDLDDTVPTYRCVRQLHPEINGETVTVDSDLAMALHNANDEHKAAETKLRGLKSELLVAMGNAESAVLGDPADTKNHIKVAKRSPHASGSVALNLARTHPAIQATKKGSAA